MILIDEQSSCLELSKVTNRSPAFNHIQIGAPQSDSLCLLPSDCDERGVCNTGSALTERQPFNVWCNDSSEEQLNSAFFKVQSTIEGES